MRERLLLGPVLIAALVGALWLDEGLAARGHAPGLVVLGLALLLAVLGARELANILRAKSVVITPWLTAGASIAGLAAVWVQPSEGDPQSTAAWIVTVAVGVFSVAVLYGLRTRSPQGVIGVIGGTLLSFVYLGVMLGFVVLFRRDHSSWELLWVLLVIKSSDIGAYFTGKAVGRHKLIPWLSPGKTREGLVGGMVLAGVVATAGLWGLASADAPLAPVWAGPIAGALFALLGQAGDLIASALKRDAGLKDSGNVLPGFGGILDVIDSPLLVVPAAYWLLRLLPPQAPPL